MGLLDKIFAASSTTKEEKVLPWLALNTIGQLKEIEAKSKAKTQVVFKHSTTCGISRMVMNQFVANYELNEKDLDLYYLDLLSYRSVSNETGYHFQVHHESPQVLVIKNAEVVRHESHGAINSIDLAQYL